MKKNIFCIGFLGCAAFLSAATAEAITVTNPATDLLHDRAYVWGVASSTWAPLVNPITYASITLEGIWDDNTTDPANYENDQLALFLLNDAYMANTTNVWRQITDNAVIDPVGPYTNSLAYTNSTLPLFAAITPLVTYYVSEDIPSRRLNNADPQPKVDLTYTFTFAQRAILQSYLYDPELLGQKYRDIALGFDPDCAFKVDKLIFSVRDNPVPEPATMLLFGTGLAGLARFCRKKKQS